MPSSRKSTSIAGVHLLHAVSNPKEDDKRSSSNVRMERDQRWREDNAGAISDYNALIEKQGIPLSEYRKL